MAQISSSQLGEGAVASPVGNEQAGTLPPPAPELHHLKTSGEGEDDDFTLRQTKSTQLGSNAVAHPARDSTFPPSAPQLFHLTKSDGEGEDVLSLKHTKSTQLGSNAVAHPAGHDGLPGPVPELYHLTGTGEEEDESVLKQTKSTQLGSNAVAHPSGHDSLPGLVPELHHLSHGTESEKEPASHASLTQPDVNSDALLSGSKDTSSSLVEQEDARAEQSFDNALRQTKSTQLGPNAIAHPAGSDSLPPSAPELYHLSEKADINDGVPLKQTKSTQIGPQAVAHPAGYETLPQPIPELHHLGSNAVSESGTFLKQTKSTQLGSQAVVPPAGSDGVPQTVPELHHLDHREEYTEGIALEQTRSTQIGPSAIAHAAGLETLPVPVPELYHLVKSDSVREETPLKQTKSTQLGPSAVAHPAGSDKLPPAAPLLYHLEPHSTKEGAPLVQTKSSQIAPLAVAPPADHMAPPHAELEFDDLPPFPEDVPIVPLLRISLRKLLEHDEEEIESLWRASRDIGFFYLDLRNAHSSNVAHNAKRDSGRDLPLPSSTGGQAPTPEADDGIVNGDAMLKDADALFTLGEQFYSLPESTKQAYDLADQGSYFGYKGFGKGVVDAKGTKDRNEFYNTSKDDILGLTAPIDAPKMLKEPASRELMKRYMQRSHAVITLILSILNGKLGLAPGRLESMHRLRARSGDQVRWVRSPPQPEDDRQRALGEHTDFGSVTVLFNRLGGLQVLPPGNDEGRGAQGWCYVKPLKHHCVINLGDAMVKFTAGLLRSNIHRVVNPPGAQANQTRMSLVYFCRPEDEVMLRVLDGSTLIDERKDEYVKKFGEETVSAKDWTLRRALGRRGIGDYAKSGGTEGERVQQ